MTGPLMLIVIGVLFLLNNLFPGQFSFGKMWPVILIVIGVLKIRAPLNVTMTLIRGSISPRLAHLLNL